MSQTASFAAFTTAHSHAFQRAMRGKAQRPGPATEDDFWTWREAMYDLAHSLTPESVYQIARIAYRELRLRGVLTVGEFHYVHHQPDGTPYDDRTVMADAVIEAARAEGLRICLLRAIYHRGGPGKPAAHAQRRFSDARLEDALGDVDTLASRYRNDPAVRVGVAPHSVRAVPPSWLAPTAAHAASLGMPLHMHVAEQPAEIDACVAETGHRPVELLERQGVLGPRFVAVHATHLLPHEAKALGEARSTVCLCPTTERDLGDGHPDLASLRASGVRLSTGVDSHVLIDPFEEMRGIELGERLRTQRRITAREPSPTPAEALWGAASINGARCLGFDDEGGRVLVDRSHPALALVDDDGLLDALVFSGTVDVIAGVER